MRPKITKPLLELLASHLNSVMKTPDMPYRDVGITGRRAQVGNYHISYAYGGASLHQISNESGGCRDVLYCGHISKRDLYELMHAFLRGIEEARR